MNKTEKIGTIVLKDLIEANMTKSELEDAILEELRKKNPDKENIKKLSNYISKYNETINMLNNIIHRAEKLN